MLKHPWGMGQVVEGIGQLLSANGRQVVMQLCEEYGTKLLASPDSDGNPNSSLVTNLTYTQALILLGIPEEERDEFIAEHDVESMTKLELQQAVKD